MPAPGAKLFRTDRRAWHYWVLLATTSAVSTLGLSSALFALVYGRGAAIWPWRHTEVTLLAAISTVLLILVGYLTYQQRKHLRFVRSAAADKERGDAERAWAEKRLSLLKNTLDNVSHEFRTPLTIIKEYASAANENLNGEGSETKEFLGIVLRSVDDLTLLVNDMLDISHIEKNILRMSRRRCRVEDIVRGVRHALERKSAHNEVVFEVELADTLPTVYCDAEKVGRVIVNLAVNALKASGQGGTVRLWARHEPNASQVRIGVTDSGPGIPQDQLSALFEQFSELRDDTSQPIEGYALGLSIACELVDLNLGDMHAGGAPGQGSAFSFTVPTAEPATLLSHYLQRSQRLRTPATDVSLLTISTEAANHPAQWADAEWFLETQVRRSDLLVKTKNHDWVLVAAANEEGAVKLVKRLETAHREVNSTRAEEALPALRIQLCGSWQLSKQAVALAECFESICLEQHQPSRL